MLPEPETSFEDLEEMIVRGVGAKPANQICSALMAIWAV